MKAENLLKKIAKELCSILSDGLVGVYAHGSVAFGCYDPKVSDIDFIVVVKRPISLDKKMKIISVLMELEKKGPEKGIEMSVVTENKCRKFVCPTPFELHYSAVYRTDYKNDLEGFCKKMKGTDPDLAAHFTVIKKVGYAVCGKKIDDVFGDVPEEYYLDSITCDISGAADDIEYNPVYYILNLCRVLAFIRSGRVCSKEQGGLWGIKHCPEGYSFVIAQALRCYRTAEEFPEDFPLRAFAEYMLGEIQKKSDTGGENV